MTDEPEKKYTHWYRIENVGREYRVVVWRHKQTPETVPGTEETNNPTDALNALGQVVIRELIAWE